MRWYYQHVILRGSAIDIESPRIYQEDLCIFIPTYPGVLSIQCYISTFSEFFVERDNHYYSDIGIAVTVIASTQPVK